MCLHDSGDSRIPELPSSIVCPGILINVQLTVSVESASKDYSVLSWIRTSWALVEMEHDEHFRAFQMFLLGSGQSFIPFMMPRFYPEYASSDTPLEQVSGYNVGKRPHQMKIQFHVLSKA